MEGYMPGNASGSFEVKFKEQKKFKAFGLKYSECFANMEVKGEFSTPTEVRDLTYKVDFKANVQCDQVLKYFSFAYDKTFSNKKLTALALRPLVFAKTSDFVGDASENIFDDTPDYTAQLVSCGLPKARALTLPQRRMIQTAGSATPPTSLQATAIDSQLAYAAPEVPIDMVNANAYTTLYSQAAARAVLKSQGVDITKTDYLTTKGWYDAVVTEMLNLGFAAEVATTGGVQQNTYSGEIEIGKIVTSLISAYLGAAEVAEFEALANMLSSDPDDTATKDFLTFWWDAASSETKRTNLAFGPLTVDQGEASITAVYFTIDVAFQDWRSLFVSFHHESLNIWSSAIKLNLNMDVYASVKDDITSAVQGAIKKHIKQTTLNFGN
jgi:hypothetical protein